MSLRAVMTGAAVLAGVALAGLAAGAAWAQAPPVRPTRPQAAAAVSEYRQAHERCATPGAECDAAAKRRFVETMNCVVLGQKAINAATLDQDFTAHVDLVSDVIDGPDQPVQTPLGPCFVGAAPAGSAGAPAAASRAPGATPTDSDGPSIEALRRFRKQAEEQSQPVMPTEGPSSDLADHEKLKAELEAMRQRLRSGAVPTGGGLGSAPGATTVTPSGAVPAPLVPAAPVVPAARSAPAAPVVPATPPVPTTPAVPAVPPVPAAPVAPPAPSGTTTIQGGPSSPGTTNVPGGSTPAGPATIQGGPTPPPAATGVIPYPGGVNPLSKPTIRYSPK